MRYLLGELIRALFARVVCMCCGCDLGPSDTERDSHGICDACHAAWDNETGCP